MDLEPRFDWTRKSAIMNNTVLALDNDCDDMHLVSNVLFLAVDAFLRWTAAKCVEISPLCSFSRFKVAEIKPFEDGEVHNCRYHLYLNHKFHGLNMPPRSCHACINVADHSVIDGKIIGSLLRRRLWATDDNRKWAVFLFYLSSLYPIYIVKYLFSGRDD